MPAKKLLPFAFLACSVAYTAIAVFRLSRGGRAMFVPFECGIVP
ncbi:MAG TPA: hypothetical protein VIK27_06445 [Candidatus Aquilonibacter sp.]